jgi:aspartyl-tRNA(Asn)/glutamyl-tRNA(Gln) amidotransferase subunit A
MPHTEYAIPVYYIIATAEASSNLARYDGVKYGYRAEGNNLEEMYKLTRSKGFGTEVKRRIMLGTYVLSAGYYEAYYLKAQKVRTLIKQDFENAFKEIDVLLTPTSPFTAFKLGEKLNDPLQMYLCDVFTIPLNLYGGCGISVPCGFDENSLPIGLQLMSSYFNEDKLFKVANAFQVHTDYHKKIPQNLIGG